MVFSQPTTLTPAAMDTDAHVSRCSRCFHGPSSTISTSLMSRLNSASKPIRATSQARDLPQNGHIPHHRDTQGTAKDTARGAQQHRPREDVRGTQDVPARQDVRGRGGDVRSTENVRKGADVRGREHVRGRVDVRRRDHERAEGGVPGREHVRDRADVRRRDDVRAEGGIRGIQDAPATSTNRPLATSPSQHLQPPPGSTATPPSSTFLNSVTVPHAREHAASVSVRSRPPGTSLAPPPPDSPIHPPNSAHCVPKQPAKPAQASIASPASASSQPQRPSPSPPSPTTIRPVSSVSRTRPLSGQPTSQFAGPSVRTPHLYPPQPPTVTLSYTSRPRPRPHSSPPRPRASSAALFAHEPSFRITPHVLRSSAHPHHECAASSATSRVAQAPREFPRQAKHPLANDRPSVGQMSMTASPPSPEVRASTTPTPLPGHRPGSARPYEQLDDKGSSLPLTSVRDTHTPP